MWKGEFFVDLLKLYFLTSILHLKCPVFEDVVMGSKKANGNGGNCRIVRRKYSCKIKRYLDVVGKVQSVMRRTLQSMILRMKQ